MVGYTYMTCIFRVEANMAFQLHVYTCIKKDSYGEAEDNEIIFIGSVGRVA